MHKGVYTSESSGVIPVAVKTCKVAGDEAMTEKFLEEACKAVDSGALRNKDEAVTFYTLLDLEKIFVTGLVKFVTAVDT